MLRIAPAYLFLLLVILGSCKKDVLTGIDKNVLFAVPSTAELEAVKTAWNKRNLNPQEVTIEAIHTISNRLSFQLLSFRLAGFKQYAGVLLPVTSKPVPVQLFVYGFTLNDPVTYQNTKVSSSDTSSLPFIFVVPALKGQSLRMMVNDSIYISPMSEGTRNDAFDGAADDVIACLNAVSMVFKQADTTRVMVRGGSRGGTVALLVAERDKRVKRTVGIAFPTDLLRLTATYQQDLTYRFQFLDALINGTATPEQTRSKMIASSPLYFCSQLPKTQIHFGDKDQITPPAQGQMLGSAMKSLGLQDSIESFIYKDRMHSNIGNDNKEMEERIQRFFHQLW
jgi:dienelactone hydrolase